MLLKSSSTPVLGSLLASFSESPGNNHYHCEISAAAAKQTPPPSYSKLSYGGAWNFSTVSCNSSPMSPAVGYPKTVLRKAQSEGNLEGLVNGSIDVDEFSFKNVPNRFARRRNSLLLETIPSFSHHNLSCQNEEEESDGEGEEAGEDFDEKDELCESYNQFGMETMSLQEKMRISQYGNVKNVREHMYLARGLGVGDIRFSNSGGPTGGNGDGGGCRPVAFDGDAGDSHDQSVEQHYKKMLEENPSNPLFLRNYAQFLYQEKRDLGGAEAYYSRAILADPSDGEVLSNYAKIVWELYHDKERATDYFERAVQIASEDSHVHAAFASFLWEVEEDEEEEASRETNGAPQLYHTGAMTFC